MTTLGGAPLMQPLISGPHAHEGGSTAWIMRQVIYALLPAAAFGVWLFGWPALNLMVVTVVACLATEAATLAIAGKPTRSFLFDGSAALSGLLLAMTLPPWAPWWIGALGGVLAMLIGKQVFGGLGNNLFNPAMVARVALLISFPLEMTTWINPRPLGSADAPGFLEGLRITFAGIEHIDAVSSASILGHVKTEYGVGHGLGESLASGGYDFLSAGLGTLNGSLGETSAVLVLAGGAYLLVRRIITWHIPAGMLGTVALLATVFNVIDPQHYPDAVFHLLTGGMLLGAFFIATDMVTSPSTPAGQIVFGAGCGLLVWVIRTWGGYPEGIAFAVLLMNALTPLIDHYLRPRIYGRDRKGAPLAPEKT